jgi:uncharacterized repeat protein (TIGR01451 family)
MKMWLALIALLAPAAAIAAGDVTLNSQVFVERAKQGPDGKTVIVREAPKVVTPGDRLVFEIAYQNKGTQPATGFSITNPIPESVAFAGGETEGAVVSVDGGKTWGALASLKVPGADGKARPATQADVTHVRWAFSRAIPAGASGRTTFRGVVK